MTTIYDEYNILIPIDVLLETHMGTAAMIDPKSPIEIIENGYFERDNNDLWEFTESFNKTEYEKQWNNRNKKTLKSSIVRNIVEYIKKMVQTKMIENHDRGGNLDITIFVNTFPYKDLGNIENYLGSIIYTIFSNMVRVKIVYIPFKELNIGYLKSNKIKVLTFNYIDDWLYHHYKDFIENPKPSIEVYVPMISRDMENKIKGALENKEIDKDFIKDMSPYRACEIYFSKIISLNFLPLEFFSIPKF